MAQLPEQYHHKANDLFHRQGLYTITGSFYWVRAYIVPWLVYQELKQRRFQIFNWLSGFLWVGLLFL